MTVTPLVSRTSLAVLVSLAIAACSDSDGRDARPDPTGTASPPVLTVRISPDEDTLSLGGSRVLVATVTDRNGAAQPASVTWSSVDPEVASVAGGTVTALAPGRAAVVARVGQHTDTAFIAVVMGGAFLQLEPTAVAINQGDTLRFDAVLLTGGGRSTIGRVAWQVSDSSTVSVGPGGLIEAHSAGDVELVASAYGMSATASVSVKGRPVKSVTISPTNVSLAVGASASLTATALDGSGRPVSASFAWSSSNTGVADVDAQGRVTAKSSGGAIITAGTGGISGTTAVNVYAAGAASVTLTLPNDSLSRGATMQASATPRDANGNPLTGRPLAWQSSNPGVATINASGLVSGLATGQTNISVIVDGIVATQKLTIVVPVATQVAVAPSDVSVAKGSSARMTAEVRDQFGQPMSGVALTWSSQNAAIAAVASDGTVTGKATGSTQVSAAAAEKSGTSAVTVTGTSVGSVAVTPATLSLMAGERDTLLATVFDQAGAPLSGRALAWSSSAPGVVSVSSTGEVVALAAGTATVTATSDGVSGTAALTISARPPAPVATVAVALNSTQLDPGQGTQAVATLRDSTGAVLTGRPVSWASADVSIATVNGAGYVTAVAAGTVTIVASAENVDGYASLTVRAPTANPVASVQLRASSDNLPVGDTVTAVATLKDAAGVILTGRTISYYSANVSIATVNASGLVRGIAPGQSTITATSEGISGKMTFTVLSSGSPPSTAPVATVTVSANPATFGAGASSQATATLRDSVGNVLTGRTVTWSSSNTAAATASQAGLVSGIAAGTATISAVSEGKAGSVGVTVTAPATVASVTVSLASSTIGVGSSTQATATARDAGGATISGRPVSWAISSGGSYASVSAGGAVTGLAAGSATVRATVDGVSGSATVTVTTAPPPPAGIVLPAMPQAYLNFSYPQVTGKTIVVNAGDNLQTALNSAVRGDQVVLAAGAVFSGNFYLPAKTGTPANGWVIIRSSSLSQLPPSGTRVTPAHAALMPRIETPNYSPALTTKPSASGWWIAGVEVTVSTALTADQGGIMEIGDGSKVQDLISEVPTDFVLDRMYIHGQAHTNTKRCLGLNSARSAVQDSYLAECHSDSYDSQAIAIWNGPGPFRIVNNTLMGAGENILFGGADAHVANMTPSDIEIRRNFIYTPPSWKNVWVKKNLLESKHAQRVLIEGNVFDGSWADGQVGFAIVLKSANQSGSCTWCRTTDVTIRQNIFRNVAAGFNLAGDAGANTNPIGSNLSRLLIEHNQLELMNQGIYTGDPKMVQVLSNVRDVTIRNNTMSTADHQTFLYLGAGAATGLAFTDNIVSRGNWGLFGAGQGEGAGALLNVFGTVTWNNACVVSAFRSGYPTGTTFSSSLTVAQGIAGCGANQAALSAATAGAVVY